MPRKSNQNNDFRFAGFDKPESNWFKMPNYWTDVTAHITTLAELKVVEYVLRHTWGYQEYDLKKHITVEEFVNGRRRQDGTRLDLGTGLSERSVQYGLKDAVEHGYLEEEIDASDRGRVKKYYSLSMRPDEGAQSTENLTHQLGVQTLHPRVQELRGRGAKAAPRTEKETRERNLEERNPINSNNIELQTQVFNGVSTFQNSKNEIEFLENHESEEGASGDEPEQQKRGDYQLLTPSTNSFTAVGDVLKGRRVGTGRKPAPRSSKTASTAASSAQAGVRQGKGKTGLPEPPEWLKRRMTELSDDLHDVPHTEGNIAQAYNLFLYTGAEERRFEQRLTDAKRLTLKYDIEKRAEGDAGEIFGQRNKMPYFFKVLRDQLGLKDIPASETKPSATRRKGRGHNVNEQLYSP